MNEEKNKLSALDVARHFLALSKKTHGKITNKKMQKLLYYAQVWYYTFNKEKLFQEDIEAWIHGPAVPEVYREFKHFGSDPIDVEIDDKELVKLSKKIADLLENIWDVYGIYDAQYLEILSHSEQPWQQARGDMSDDEPSTAIIDLEVARGFYGKKLKEAS